MKFLVLALAVVAGVGAASINSGYVLPAGNIGTSGILRKDGSVELFSHDFAHDIVAIGPSGIVTKSGRPIQLDANLNLVRNKRHLVGDSGMITDWGQAVVFKKAFTTILLEGPSGILLSDGQLLQRPAPAGRTKRHIVGDTGMITDWGLAVNFKKPFTTIVNDGPSGIVLSDGQQFQRPAH